MEISRYTNDQAQYYRGELLFDKEPDWDAIAKLVRFMNASGRENLHPYRATHEGDAYWLPFAYRYAMRQPETRRPDPRRQTYQQQPGSRQQPDSRQQPNSQQQPDSRRDRASQVDEFRDMQAQIDDSARLLLEDIFGCAAELDALDLDLANASDLDFLADIIGGRRSFGGHEWPYASDIMPEPDPSTDALPKGATSAQKSAAQELDALIGLDSVKRQLNEIVVYASACDKGRRPCMHMVFRGNPGTGKTAVARIVGRMLCEAGILANPDVFIETDRSGLVGEFVGHTAVKTADLIRLASGGVLFIDEAYALGMYAPDLGASPDGGGGRRDFGDEAISTLVKEMEDHRDSFVCIMAGYTKPMDHMLRQNPGLRDRVGFYLDFPDYSADELLQIFRKFATDDGLSVDDEAEAILGQAFGRMVACKPSDFSNGRIVRKVFERARMKQALLLAEKASTRAAAGVMAAGASSVAGAMAAGASSVAADASSVAGASLAATGAAAGTTMTVITGEAIRRTFGDADLAHEAGRKNDRTAFGFCAPAMPLRQADASREQDDEPATSRLCG